MKWAEFRSLVTGLGAETPLGQVIRIRAEDDPESLKNFTDGQRRINSEWRKKQAKARSEQEIGAFLESMKQAFIELAGDAGG